MRRRTSEWIITACVVPTLKYDEENVMIWNCSAGNTFGDIWCQEYWINMDITLSYSAMPFHLGQGWSVIDLCLCKIMTWNIPLSYVKTICKRKKNKLTVMEWPFQSPECNPIELVWDELDCRVKKQHQSSAETLWTLLKKEGQNITSEYLLSLIERMARGCSPFIKRTADILMNPIFTMVYIFL